MKGSLENRFNGIKVDSHKGNSDIIIKRRIFFQGLLGPKAIVKCGFCGNKYTTKLMYLFTDFVMENDELECKKCGNVDYITYRKSS